MDQLIFFLVPAHSSSPKIEPFGRSLVENICIYIYVHNDDTSDILKIFVGVGTVATCTTMIIAAIVVVI